MQTRVSTKGQVVLPLPLRRRLGIQAGDPLDVNVEDGCIVLKPKRNQSPKARIIVDSLTGLPALSLGSDAPTLTSEMVAEMLADFP